LTRSYESNGPDVKIRGNAQHVAEKYLQLARDAHTGGDPVAAENYLQHAEHYFRLIAAAQAAQALAQSGQVRSAGDSELDELEDDDDIGGLSDRFASPSERGLYQQQQQPHNVPQPQPGPAPGTPQPYAERQPFEDRQGQNERGPFPNRQDRQNNRFPDRNSRQDRPYQERGEGYRGDGRQNRDGRPRDFRPYRDPNAQAPREGVTEGSSAPNLPSFITGGPRIASGEAEGAPAPFVEPAQQVSAAPDAPFSEQVSEEARFPGRGRRRRLRSPYGFNAAQEDSEQPGERPVSDETPVSE
jgi:hypothetical protein